MCAKTSARIGKRTRSCERRSQAGTWKGEAIRIRRSICASLKRTSTSSSTRASAWWPISSGRIPGFGVWMLHWYRLMGATLALLSFRTAMIQHYRSASCRHRCQKKKILRRRTKWSNSLTTRRAQRANPGSSTIPCWLTRRWSRQTERSPLSTWAKTYHSAWST